VFRAKVLPSLSSFSLVAHSREVIVESAHAHVKATTAGWFERGWQSFRLVDCQRPHLYAGGERSRAASRERRALMPRAPRA
jgi:hypothetical protein